MEVAPLPTSGLLVEHIDLSKANTPSPRRDVVPADNSLAGFNNGCDQRVNVPPDVADIFEGDLFRSDTKSQLTPWTRPNSWGRTFASDVPLAERQDNWSALDDIRDAGLGDGSISFDFYDDFREAPELVVRADSWMGQETDGYVFDQPVRVTNGAFLRVWENATIVFAGGLTVEDGSEFICKTGSTCIDETGAVITGAESCIIAEAGATYRSVGGATFTAGGFIANNGGTVEVADGASLVFDATAGTSQVQPGARFLLGGGSRVRFEGPVDVVGTASAPVRFERLDPSQKWNRVEVLGDGSRFDHVAFDGGVNGPLVRAQDVEFRNTVVTDGGYGMYVTGTSGRRADVYLDNVLIDGSHALGLVARYADVVAWSTTVRGSGNGGAYVYNATFNPAFSVIEGSGRLSSSMSAGSGILVNYGGVATMDLSFFTDAGFTTVRGSATHELYPSSNGVVNAARNNVYDDDPAGSPYRLVYSTSSHPVDAARNYWGTPSPAADRFHGAVDYSSPSSNSDPVYGYNPPAGGGTEAAPGGARLAAARGADVERGEATDEGHRERLRAAIVAARDALREGAATPGGAALVAALHGLQVRDPLDGLDERAATYGLVAEFARGEAGASAETVERAALTVIGEAIARGGAAGARAALDELGSAVRSPRGLSELAEASVVVLEQEGRYAEALAALATGAAVLDPVFVADLRAYVGELAAVSGTPLTGVLQVGGPTAEPVSPSAVATGLSAPHPNPTRGQVALDLSLAEDAEVEVAAYDVLGRRVAVLASGALGAGTHALVFDGSRLPSGVYVVRAEVRGGGSAEAFTRRLTVAR